jgi:predicted ATPase/class 3 adenylate cyclase
VRLLSAALDLAPDETSAFLRAAGDADAVGEVRVFLIADIRGYTRFTAEWGDEEAARLASRFAKLCEETVRLFGGELVEMRGDEALVAFSSARHALRAAVALQESASAETEQDPDRPLPVGIGLDAGEPVAVGTGYRGGALNLAARLCSIAESGEILASETIIGLARRTEGLTFVDRGQVILKGIDRPVRVVQVGAEGALADTLPPIQSRVATHPNNLPDEPTRFIGRQREIEEIAARLRETGVRLVTLTGPGGTGKTRLALQVSARLLYTFRDGVFFTDLAPLADAALVPAAILEALGAREDGEADVSGALLRFLSGKQILLILDNFEHLADASAAVAEMLDRCRELTILVTSRMPLRLRREHEYGVEPLATPDVADLTDLSALTQLDSVALFIERAQAVKHSFQLEDDNATAVAEICSRLDGLPLAIELAAARVRLFPPQALLEGLSSRLALLSGGARDLPERQRTLRGAVDWSYSLLTDGEKTMFARTSVFAGGFSLAAAEAVCDPDRQLPIDSLDAVASLVEQNLLRQTGAVEPRLGMLETIREYAKEKLRECREENDIRRAHAHYYLQFAEEAAPKLTEPDGHIWVERLAGEYENLRLALEWFAAKPDTADEGLRLVAALSLFWFFGGRFREGLYWLERMLERGDRAVAPPRIAAMWGAGFLWTLVGDEERARPLLEHSLEQARQVGHDSLIARSLNWLGLLAFFKNDHVRARELWEESVAVARIANDDWCLADVLGTLGSSYPLQGEFQRAMEAGREGLSIARKRGERQGIRMSLFGLALTAVRRGELVAARTWAGEGLAISRDLADLWFVSYFLWILATVSVLMGDLMRAKSEADESLAVARELNAPLLIVCALEASAMAARADGDVRAAETLLLEAESAGRGALVPHSYLAAVLRLRGELAIARGEPTSAEGLLAESLSLSRGLNDDWSTARTLVHLAELKWQEKEADGALPLLRDAIELQRRIEDSLGLAESLECLVRITAEPVDGERARRLQDAASELRAISMQAPARETAQQRVKCLEHAVSLALGRR